ncbi:MAG: exonuclease SbcCD subunit D, partial [Anaerolineales bacterium]
TGTSSRVRDFLDRLDEVIEYALEHEADLVIFAGDAFKNRDPKPTQQREFARRIKRLADSIPILLLVGNHDMPGMAAKANSLDIFRALDVPGVIVGYKPEGRVIETRRGPVFLAWMPYPMRNRLMNREEHQGKSIEELEIALRETVSVIVRNFAEEADGYEMPRVLAGHFSVAEAEFGSERSVMLGRDVAMFTSVLADPRWDYIALGHIHKHQSLNQDGYPPVVYSGSLERIDFGEEVEEKGFCWVELARTETRWSFVPVASRSFLTVRVDVRETPDPTAAVLAKLEGLPLADAVVRVQVKLRAEQEAALREREVEAVLDQAAHFSIAREVESEARSRLGGLAPETLSPLELVERYFLSRDVEEDRLSALLTKAEGLLREETGPSR